MFPFTLLYINIYMWRCCGHFLSTKGRKKKKKKKTCCGNGSVQLALCDQFKVKNRAEPISPMYASFSVFPKSSPFAACGAYMVFPSWSSSSLAVPKFGCSFFFFLCVQKYIDPLTFNYGHVVLLQEKYIYDISCHE